MADISSVLGLRLLELRQERDLTQKQLCADLNISRANYSYYENGRRLPDLNTLLLIARYYSVSLDELVSYSSGSSADSADSTNLETAIKLFQHLQAKHIPVEDIQGLSKMDFDFLMEYKKLTDDNKAELSYMIDYKLRKQKK